MAKRGDEPADKRIKQMMNFILQEAREKAEHALKRIMAVQHENGKILITTTDMHLARTIGDALCHAYEGEVDYEYTDEANILRVSWER